MICRLCLKEIPQESSIKLYENLELSSEYIEIVKLIEKYLEIEIKHNDIVSTIICQNCYDHLEEFHRFSQQVAEKQLTLRKEFLDVNFKREFIFDDDNGWHRDVESQEEKFPTNPKEITQEIPINCPVNMLKYESDNDENDEQEIATEDIFNSVTNNEEKDIIAPDSVAPNSESNVHNQLSSDDDDVPLIKFKSAQKQTLKTKRKKASTMPHECKVKKPVKKKLSAEKEVALSVDLICDICQTRVDTWKALREHFLLAHTKTPYIKCCDIIYRKPRALIEHLEWHKNPDMFKCQICDKNMSSARSLTIHITSEHPDKANIIEFFECEHCSKRIRNYNLFKKHLRSHNKDKEVDCHICNKRFTSEYHLDRHIGNFHKKAPPHICDVCGRTYKNKTAFKRHYNEHQGIVSKAVQCSICNTWLKNEDSLRLHRFTHEEHPTPCDICGKIFKTKRRLYRHKIYWHTLDTNLQCSFCDKSFREKRNLDEHMAIHTGVQLYTCPHCGKDSRSKSNMYVHIKRMHPDEWWASKMQRLNLKPKDIVFRSENNLNRHIQNIHKYIKYHICDVCGQKFKNKDSFKNHYAQHQGIIEPAAQCSICYKWLKNKHSLRMHRFVHEKNPTPCEICGKIFETKHSLRKHKSYWHKSDLNLPCNFCDRVFRQERNLYEHMATHTGVQLYKCPHCQKESRSKSNICATIYRLRNHIASVHNNIYHHICDICGKKFKSKTSFQKHYDEHQGIVEPPAQCKICGAWLKNQHSLRVHHQTHEDTQFACDICGKFFKTKKNLSRHKGYWHRRERNLSCSYCEKVFREKRNLEEHMAMHTDTNLYTCPHCGKESRSKSNMYVHVKRQHPDEWWKSKQERYKLKTDEEEQGGSGEEINDNSLQVDITASSHAHERLNIE